MKVVLYMAMTVNGMIAKENDETPWSDAEWASFAKIVKQFKNLVIGRRTYEIMKSDKDLFSKIGNPFVVVVTSQKSKASKNLAFAKSPKEALSVVKEKGFSAALLGCGAHLNAAFAKENLIDEIILDVEPMFFGKGIKLFADADFEVKLKLLEVRKLSKDELQLHYKVLK